MLLTPALSMLPDPEPARTPRSSQPWSRSCARRCREGLLYIAQARAALLNTARRPCRISDGHRGRVRLLPTLLAAGQDVAGHRLGIDILPLHVEAPTIAEQPAPGP